MQKTVVVMVFFLAALLAGWYMSRMKPEPSEKKDDDASKERFAQKEVGMPLDTQPVTGYSGTSPLLGSEPKPVSEKPYEMANDQELFLFEGNKMSADCCPSAFSGDQGCICLTDEQVKNFASRGGNRA